MPNITIDPKTIRPLRGSNVTMSDAGEDMALGDLVYVSGDGVVSLCDASDSATVTGRMGMAIGVSNYLNSGQIALGERLSVLWFGRVAIPGAALDVTKQYFASDDPGKIADAAGSTTRAVGAPESEEIFFFNADTVSPTST